MFSYDPTLGHGGVPQLLSVPTCSGTMLEVQAQSVPSYAMVKRCLMGKIRPPRRGEAQKKLGQVFVDEFRHVKHVHSLFVAENFGKIPDGKQGSGNNSWLFVDEISIE